MYCICLTDIHINFVGLYQIIFNILTAWVYMHGLGWKLNVHAAYVHYEDQDIHNIRKLLVCFGGILRLLSMIWSRQKAAATL